MRLQVQSLSSAARAQIHGLLTDPELTSTRRADAAKALASDPANCSPVAGLGHIDSQARFKTARDVAAHLVPALGTDPAGRIVDPGINAFFMATYWDQVVPSKLDVGRILLDPRDGTGSGLRPRRNPLVAYVTVWVTLGERAALAAPFLGCQPSAIPRPLGRICDRPSIARSAGALELVGAMFLTPKGNFRRPQAHRNAKLDPMQALDTLVTVVFGQMGRNYDVDGMTAGQLFELIPNVPILKPWTDGLLGRLSENAHRGKRAT